ncbi:MAG: hypothetical protein IPL28_09150 [Chloroflexi bacterium]|nr:hypothetical protein [Chloroflexota bacterium]
MRPKPAANVNGRGDRHPAQKTHRHRLLTLMTSTPSAIRQWQSPAWLEAESWVYQLSGYPNEQLAEIAAAEFDVAVTDLARDGYEGYFTAAEITTVKESGKYACWPISRLEPSKITARVGRCARRFNARAVGNS